jgi:hypothetical protein
MTAIVSIPQNQTYAPDIYSIKRYLTLLDNSYNLPRKLINKLDFSPVLRAVDNLYSGAFRQ